MHERWTASQTSNGDLSRTFLKTFWTARHIKILKGRCWTVTRTYFGVTDGVFLRM